MVEPIISEYIRLFYKINEIYSHHTFDNETDLLDEISYYNSKSLYSDIEIQEVEKKCVDEWKTLFLKICDYSINEIESNKNYIKILKIELKQLKKLSVNMKHGHKKLDEYEEIYDGKLEKLIDNVEVQIDKDKLDEKQFKWGLFISIIAGFVGGFVTGYVLFQLGYT